MKYLTFTNILFSLLSIIIFFFLGTLICFLTKAAEGQGLAGGAIVLFYGFIGSVIGLILSIILAKTLDPSYIKRANLIFGLLTLAFILFSYVRYQRIKPDKPDTTEIKDLKPTSPAEALEATEAITPPAIELKKDEAGLGMFKPNIHTLSKLDFYNNPRHASPGSVQDSLVFGKTEHGSSEITYAPPYFYPAHMKMDYDILLLRLHSVESNLVEVEANKETGQKVFLRKEDGVIQYWPDFLLGVNSIEISDEHPQGIKVKPLENSSEVRTPYDFLAPSMIKDDWMEVKLMNNDYTEKRRGWIKWKSKDILLINYKLLS